MCVVLALIGSAIFVGSAAAGTYTVVSCADSVSHAYTGGADGWSQSLGDGLRAQAACGPAGAQVSDSLVEGSDVNGLLLDPSSAASVAVGSAASWKFTSPAATEIASYEIASAGNTVDGSWQVDLQALGGSASDLLQTTSICNGLTVGALCAMRGTAPLFGTPGGGPFSASNEFSGTSPATTTQLSLRLKCVGVLWMPGSPCQATAPGTPGGRPYAELFGTRIGIADATAPAVEDVSSRGGTVMDGSLLPNSIGSPASDPKSGVKTVRAAASDLGAGVYTADLQIDGSQIEHKIVDSNSGKCADFNPNNSDEYEFSSAQPCPTATTSVEFSIDTLTKITQRTGDGLHQVSVKFHDASGNVSASTPGVNFTVENNFSFSYPGGERHFETGSEITPITAETTHSSPVRFELAGGTSLPAGLSLDANTGAISGSPTSTALVDTYTVIMRNAPGYPERSTSANVSISVEDAKFRIGPSLPPKDSGLPKPALDLPAPPLAELGACSKGAAGRTSSVAQLGLVGQLNLSGPKDGIVERTRLAQSAVKLNFKANSGHKVSKPVSRVDLLLNGLSFASSTKVPFTASLDQFNEGRGRLLKGKYRLTARVESAYGPTRELSIGFVVCDSKTQQQVVDVGNAVPEGATRSVATASLRGKNVVAGAELLVGLERGANARSLAQDLPGSAVSSGSRTLVVDLPRGVSPASVVDEAEDLPGVAYAEPNTFVEADSEQLEVNDPEINKHSTWYLANPGAAPESATEATWDADVDALEAWNLIGLDPLPATVAVIDSGVQVDHPDLAGQVIDDCVQAVQGNGQIDPGCPDTGGHGTHVAGIIGARANNGIYGAGVAPQVRIWVCKALSGGQEGRGSVRDVAACIDRARALKDRYNIRTINLSLGSGTPSTTLQRAIGDARNAGILTVASAGNTGSNAVEYPAAFDDVVSVAALTPTDQRADFSTFNSQVDIAAPGQAIISTVPRGTCLGDASLEYCVRDGTSMAAPMVSGIAAATGARLGIDGDALRSQILSTADDLDVPGRDDATGAGRVNFCRAINGGCKPGRESGPPNIGLAPIDGKVIEGRPFKVVGQVVDRVGITKASWIFGSDFQRDQTLSGLSRRVEITLVAEAGKHRIGLAATNVDGRTSYNEKMVTVVPDRGARKLRCKRVRTGENLRVSCPSTKGLVVTVAVRDGKRRRVIGVKSVRKRGGRNVDMNFKVPAGSRFEVLAAAAK